MHHQGRLGIEGNADEPDGLGFTDRHRRPLGRAGPAPPDLTPDWIPPPSNWIPPTGEPIHTKWVDFTHPKTGPSDPPATPVPALEAGEGSIQDVVLFLDVDGVAAGRR